MNLVALIELATDSYDSFSCLYIWDWALMRIHLYGDIDVCDCE